MSRIARLFTIQTRTEAFLVIYAIAMGAVERGRHYLATMSGPAGYILAAACTGVVFVAGAKLLDSVRIDAARRLSVAALVAPARPARRRVSRNRPKAFPTDRASAARYRRRTD